MCGRRTPEGDGLTPAAKHPDLRNEQNATSGSIKGVHQGSEAYGWVPPGRRGWKATG